MLVEDCVVDAAYCVAPGVDNVGNNKVGLVVNCVDDWEWAGNWFKIILQSMFEVYLSFYFYLFRYLYFLKTSASDYKIQNYTHLFCNNESMTKCT